MRRILDSIPGAALLGLLLSTPTYFLSFGVTKFICGVVALATITYIGVRYMHLHAQDAEAEETAKVEEPAG